MARSSRSRFWRGPLPIRRHGSDAILLLFLAGLIVAGCGPSASRPGVIRPPADWVRIPLEDVDDESRRRSPAISAKEVRRKVEPSVLVARDGTRCLVTENRFRRIEIGDWIRCAWTRTEEAGSLVTLPAVTGAQAPEEAEAERAGRDLCFRAAPFPECRSFLVTEAAVGRRLFGTGAPEGQLLDQMMEWRAVIEIGAMMNRDERSALGGSGVLRLGDEVLIWGLRGRYRRWLSNGDAWEISAAALSVSGSNSAPDGSPGSVQWASYDGLGGEVGASWSPAGWIAVGSDVVAMPFAGGGWDVSVQPSLRLTGPAGLVTALLFGAVAATDPSMAW